MPAAKRKRLRPTEVPPVLYALVSKKALRRSIPTRFLKRPSGKQIVLYERRRQAAQRSTGTSIMLRVSARASMKSGVVFYKGQGTRYEAARIPLKYIGCAKLPSWLRDLPVIDAAGGVVVTNGPKARILLLSKSDGKAKRWVLPKGTRGRSESRRGAARREVLEESGLGRVDVGPFLNRERYFDVENGRVVFKEVSYFFMRCPKGRTRLRVNRAEGFKSGQWMPIDKALAATNPIRAHRSIRKARSLLNSRQR